MATKAQPKAKSTVQGLQGSEFSAKTRLLLALWDMGGGEQEVKKGELTARITRTTEKAADYQGIFSQLEKEEAIALSKNKISLSAKGIQILGEGLKNPEFEFDRQIGAKTANALLRWIREMGTLTLFCHFPKSLTISKFCNCCLESDLSVIS